MILAKQQQHYEKPADVHAKNLVVLKDKIKSGDISGVYLFYGDEEYTKNHYCNLLTQSDGSLLNVTSFYESEFEITEFISACETSAVTSFDLFSDDESDDGDDEDSYRIVKLYNPDFSKTSKSDEERLLSFLGDFPQKTAVIFRLYEGQQDVLSKAFYKKLIEIALVVNFKREPIGSSVLISWILRHFSKEKLNVERYVALHLCQVVGNSMTELKNEIDKLCDYLKYENRDTLTKEDIDFICIKSTNAQVFDVSNGALSGDFVKAAKALEVLRDKKEKPILITGTIFKAVNDLCMTDYYIKNGVPLQTIAQKTKLLDFQVKNLSNILTSRNRDFSGNNSFPKAASKLCIEYDKKIKSSRTDGYELILELVFKLSYCGRAF